VSVCTATKRNGEPCTLPAIGKHGTCWAHSPETVEAQRRRAARGGRAKANRELPAIKALCEDLTEQVLAGKLETSRAIAVNQIANTRLRALELGRKITEQEDLLDRLERLESLAEHQKGVSKWRQR
jgi:hypothetical protein